MPAGGASRWGASRWCQQVVLEQCESEKQAILEGCRVQVAAASGPVMKNSTVLVYNRINKSGSTSMTSKTTSAGTR